jgi:hypothetical protein
MVSVRNDLLIPNLIVHSLDIYGTSKAADSTTTNGLINGHAPSKKVRTVIHLSLRDSLPAYGPIASMTFSLARNGVGFQLYLTILAPDVFHRIVLFQNLLLRLDPVSWEASPYFRYLDLTFFFFATYLRPFCDSVTFQ